jgi:hypothetical protein
MRPLCGGRTHSLGGEGAGANSTEDARHCSVLYICKYFVSRGKILKEAQDFLIFSYLAPSPPFQLHRTRMNIFLLEDYYKKDGGSEAKISTYAYLYS